MSNYKLDHSQNARYDIYNAANNLLRKSMSLHACYCPLTRAEMLLASTTEVDRAAFEHIRQRKFYLPTNHYANVWVRGEGVTTGTRVKFRAPGLPYIDNETVSLTFDLDVLDNKRRAVFVKWLNALNRETRLYTVATAIAKEFVYTRCGSSVASMHRRWPEFMLVLTSMHKPWPDRARSLGKVRMAQYEWGSGDDYNWYLENMKRIEIISTMLAGATMITVPEDKAELRCEVIGWDKTPKPVVQS
jgi:hypothetical protein